MSKKHFEMLANELALTRPGKSAAEYPLEYAQWSRDVAAVAQVCLNLSRSFDYQRFILACQVR